MGVVLELHAAETAAGGKTRLRILEQAFLRVIR